MLSLLQDPDFSRGSECLGQSMNHIAHPQNTYPHIIDITVLYCTTLCLVRVKHLYRKLHTVTVIPSTNIRCSLTPLIKGCRQAILRNKKFSPEIGRKVLWNILPIKGCRQTTVLARNWREIIPLAESTSGKGREYVGVYMRQWLH